MSDKIYSMLNAHLTAMPSEPLCDEEVSAVMSRFRQKVQAQIRPTKQNRRRAVLLTVFAAAMLSGTAYASEKAASKYADQPPVYDADGNPVPRYVPAYQVNGNGQTYGSAVVPGDPEKYVYLEDYPDLISVIGDHGIQGYLYLEDFIGDDIKTPEEAAAQSEAIRNGTYVPKSRPVYASDGKTVIDTFTPGSTH